MGDQTTRVQHGDRSLSFGAARSEAGPDRGDRLRDAGRHWQSFLEPADSADFLDGWLGLTCLNFRTALSGVLFVRGERGQLSVGARWHLDEAALEAAGKLAEAVGRSAEPTVRPHAGASFVALPILVADEVHAVIAVLLGQNPGAGLRDMLRQLHWSAGWIEARLWRGRSVVADEQRRTARIVVDLLAAADTHRRHDASAMAVVNAVTDLTGFDRAMIALNRSGRARLVAMSRSASFKRRSELVQTMQAAADEIVARGEPVMLPAAEDGAGVDLANRLLRDRLDAGALIGVPLIVRGAAVGALIVARSRADAERVTLDPASVDQLRLAAAAIAPVLWLKQREHRWLSGRARHLGGRAATAVLGRRPALALAAWAALLVLLGPSFVDGEFRVRADATLRGAEQRAAIAPIDGYVREALVRAGDLVTQGAPVAILDTRDLELERAQALSRLRQAEQESRTALAAGDRTASARAAAEAAEAASELELIVARLQRATVLAPLTGMVVSGDLSQRLGTPVSRGEVLFEIAALDDWRVLVDVSEYDIGHVRTGQEGDLVLTGLSAATVPFTVTGIASVSEPGDGANRFRVEADVDVAPDGLRPGMEGVAKIDIGQRRLVWIWARGMIDRLRVLIWRLTP